MSSPNEAQKKLQDYRNFIEEKFGKEYISDDQELTLMSIKSLEVSSKMKFPHLKIKMELFIYCICVINHQNNFS